MRKTRQCHNAIDPNPAHLCKTVKNLTSKKQKKKKEHKTCCLRKTTEECYYNIDRDETWEEDERGNSYSGWVWEWCCDWRVRRGLLWLRSEASSSSHLCAQREREWGFRVLQVASCKIQSRRSFAVPEFN